MSLIVLPSGKCATFEAALEGTGMTSEQSTSSYTLFPSVDIFAIACVKRSTMSFWLAVMRVTLSAGGFGRGEMGVRRLTGEGLPLASRARVPGIECEYVWSARCTNYSPGDQVVGRKAELAGDR